MPIAEQEEPSRLLDESEQPRTPIEAELAHIWSQVLRLERVGIHEHFFQLGGHSLLATRVVSHARAAFQIDLSLQSLFVAPTIADMARTIEQQQNEQGERHVAGIQRGERDDAERLLEQLDQLSPEEMEALFNTLVTEEEIDE